MGEVLALAFEDHLVRAVVRNGEPWFVGKDVCASLAIKNHNDALGSLDDDEKGVANTDPLTPGGSQTAIIVSEPGVYRLVFRSRKPEAERFKRWLAHDVLPELRRTGKYAAPGGDHASEGPGDASGEGLRHRLDLVREARILFGADRARGLWRQMGLPQMPPPPATARDEAAVCLRHLLDHAAYEGGPRIRDLLALALDDDEEARALLLGCGIRVMSERDVFVIANRHPRLMQIFRASPWSGPLGHVRVLRRLDGVEAAGPMRWPGLADGIQPVMRGTVFKGEALDEYDS